MWHVVSNLEEMEGWKGACEEKGCGLGDGIVERERAAFFFLDYAARVITTVAVIELC